MFIPPSTTLASMNADQNTIAAVNLTIDTTVMDGAVAEDTVCQNQSFKENSDSGAAIPSQDEGRTEKKVKRNDAENTHSFLLCKVNSVKI